jgi:hypothetical protein
MRGPDFIARLDLAPDADQRQVRRAYARELKLIDQERDLEGFQYLRACYETALEWAARREAEPSASPAGAVASGQLDAAQTPAPLSFAQDRPAPPPPLPNPVPQWKPADPPPPPLPSPHQLGGAAFAEFQARMPALVSATGKGALDDAQRSAPWRAALQDALLDPRLLNLDARLVFEQRVAALLAGGWQPGHHLLLAAADTVFGWSADRHAFARLGYAGAFLDKALEQHEMFLGQADHARAEQRHLLTLLRAGRAPDLRMLNLYIGALRVLETYFAALLTVVAPRAEVDRWHAMGAAIPSPPPAQPAAPPARSGRSGSSGHFLFAMVVLALLRMLGTFADHSSGQPSGRPPYTSQASWSPWTAVHGLAPAGQRKVAAMQSAVTGADPGGVAAVEKAIASSGPFPPGPPLIKPAPLLRPASAPAPLAAPVHHGPAVPEERMGAIRLRMAYMDYRPGEDLPPGEQKVTLQVELDPDGNIRRIKRLSVQGDPALAEAFERAIRSTGPFPPETARSFTLWYGVKVGERRPKAAPAASAPAAATEPASAPEGGAP